MSKSDDNTNELESYGVWVKNSTGNSDNTETPADTSDELNLDDGGLDLPDFDDSDFSDMFKDDAQDSASGAVDDFGSEDDTTLSTDELANITDGFEVEQVDAPAESDDLDMGDLGDFDIPETEAETSAEPEFEIEADAAAEADTEAASDDLSFDIEESIEDTDISGDEVSFDMDLPETPADETVSEEVSFDIDEGDSQGEEISLDSASSDDASEDFSAGDDEEISLDDFMDGGFSDESVAAGNNGYEPGAEPGAAAASSETEELSLDDFMDGESFDSAPEGGKEEAVIEDEAPLDMDISFDDSADTVETEDNVSLDVSSDDDDMDFDSEETEETETEEVSMDDFGSSFTAGETTTPSEPSAEAENINTEDVDLSDFGIDANAEETPIVQDVEEAKNKEKVVDYDLSVGDENTASAPVVNEIKSEAVEEVEAVEEAAAPAEPAPANSTAVDNSLLQQIVSELSSLKDEMNKLKTNLQEIKTQDNTSGAVTGAAIAAGVAAGAAAGTAAASLASNDDIDPEKAEEDKGGFFSDDDEDETIALSFDELDNIMNTAEFSDTVEADTGSDVEDTVIEESVISSEVEETADSDSIETEIENAVSTEADTSLDDINFEEDQTEENFDYSDEKLEEPQIDEFIPDGNDELYENEELPDEISIPKSDDLLVESNSSDFMDSVKETSEPEETSTEFISDESIEEDTADLPSELPDSFDTSSEPVIESTDDDIPTVDKVLGDEPEITEEEAVTEEEVAVEEEVTEEAPVTEAPASFAEVDNLDNTLSESNLAYLDKQSGEEVSDSIANTELKQDIKSVLLYMDQLLENLPEDKIVEFAKSDEFVTYKKLFNELGLS